MTHYKFIHCTVLYNIVVSLLCKSSVFSQTFDENNVNIEKILQIYISTCGPKSLCYPDIYLDQIVPPIDLKYCTPCPKCFCDDMCHSLDDCCPDIQLNKTLRLSINNREQLSEFVCTQEADFQLQWMTRTAKFATDPHPVLIKCPKNYSNTMIIEQCENPLLNDSLARVPVTSALTGLSYKNVYCFSCHDAVQPVLWDMRIKRCGKKIPAYNLFSSFYDIMENLNDSSCTVLFELNTDLPFTRNCPSKRLIDTCSKPNIDLDVVWACANVHLETYKFYLNPFCFHCNRIETSSVSVCNSTGAWQTFDESLMKGCENGTESKMKIPKQPYKNVHCVLCNEEHNMRDECIPESERPLASTGLLFDITSVFGSIHIGPRPGKKCNDGELFDPYKQVCRPKVCPFGQYFRGDKCQNIMKSKNFQLAYTLFFRLRSLESMSAKSYCNIMEEFLTDFAETLFIKLIPISSKLAIKFPTFSAMVLPSNNDTKFYDKVKSMFGGTDSHELGSDDILVSMDLFFYSISDRAGADKVMLESKESSYRLKNGSNMTYLFQAYGDDRAHVLPRTELREMTVCTISTNTNLKAIIPYQIVSDILVCIQVVLDEDEFEILNEYSIFVPVLFRRFGVSEYHLQGHKARICVRDYLDSHPGNIDDLNSLNSIISNLTLVSVICLGLSLFCIVLTLFTYCVFPKYRTLPGKLTMCLVMSLFVAITLFGISFYSTVPHTICLVIGASLHYFWLCFFFCMNACTIHMFRVFNVRKITRYSVRQEQKQFMLYTTYVTAAPAVILSITVAVSVRVWGSYGFGSRNGICFLDEPILQGAAFVLPVSVLIVADAILFMCTLFYIRSNPRVPNDAGNRYQVCSLAKLFTLTGVTWILHIFDTLLEYTDYGYFVISFAAIVMTSSQGIFIFISFICNTRTYHCYKELFARVKKPQATKPFTIAIEMDYGGVVSNDVNTE